MRFSKNSNLACHPYKTLPKLCQGVLLTRVSKTFSTVLSIGCEGDVWSVGKNILMCVSPTASKVEHHSKRINSSGFSFCKLPIHILFKNHSRGFPGGAVVGSLPANTGGTGSSPGLGRSHVPRGDCARGPQLLSLRVWSLCPATGEAAVVGGPRTAMRSGPHLPQLEKALAQKRRPNSAINK